jgi:hypothetical protein
MKAAKTTSQIKCFIHLFGGHGSKNTQVFFFRHTLKRREIPSWLAGPKKGWLPKGSQSIVILQV